MMLKTINGILIVSIAITHKENTKILEDMIVDTGSAHTWVNLEAIENDLDVAPENCDQIVTAFGIGGRDIANCKRIDRMTFGTFHAKDFHVDFGRLDDGISSLIGLDLLMAGNCVLDLSKPEPYQAPAISEVEILLVQAVELGRIRVYVSDGTYTSTM
ncbi:MAG: retropepsin-like domain-containing protein [Alicyclobacillus sp.]|nr:retropepsin-like domain-containing protein [Alicyclobacillus sp.]